MSPVMKKRSKKVGLAPGTLVHIGAERAGKTAIDITEYDADHVATWRLDSLEQCPVLKPSPTVTWINVEGLHQVEVMHQFGECYGIHPLVLEDIVATDQRPKAEDHEDYLYVVLKMTSLDQETEEIKSEQVSIILDNQYLITFQEGLEGDVFEQVRTRLKNPKSKLRHSGADLLLHALLDVIVDDYFLILEKIAEKIEDVEDELIRNPSTDTLHTIYKLKREMLFLHKVLWPLREMVGSLQRRDTSLIHDETLIYLRDLYDHSIQVLDTLETLRDMLAGMIDIYLSSMSNRLNEVMKVLTIIATIFMPLSFIVGWYGMNFKYMPELDWPYSYPIVLLVMGIIAGGMVVYFRRKRWI